jgi:hypothetical protein
LFIARHLRLLSGEVSTMRSSLRNQVSEDQGGSEE